MVLPFRRKDKDEKVTVNDEDEDINALLNAESFEDFATNGASSGTNDR